jgi:hypothetical protein
LKWQWLEDVATMDSKDSLPGRLHERWADLDRGWRAAALGLVAVLFHVPV